jgi:hypothetical protein
MEQEKELNKHENSLNNSRVSIHTGNNNNNNSQIRSVLKL